MSKVIDRTDNEMLKKHNVSLDDHTWVEDGWLHIEMGTEVGWDSIQDIDEILSNADPDQDIYRDYTAMGDDVPNTLTFRIEALDEIDAILQENDESLQEVLWMAGPGTYSDEFEDEDEDEDDLDW